MPALERSQPILTGESDDELLLAWLRFSAIQLSPRLAFAMLRRFHFDPRLIFDAPDSQICDIPGVMPRHLDRLREPSVLDVPQQLDWFQRNRLVIVHPECAEYSELLLQIPDPPPFLYLWGARQNLNGEAIGIVGSRRATPYGRAVAEKIAKDLAKADVIVISGGAVGIDVASHRGALSSGVTIAALGCGLNIDYPRENRELFREIREQGALISEYPPGFQPEAWHFPARNRIISGLSAGVLVVEAPRQSGALITARYAEEQNRTVFAVPGNIDRITSQGCNELLRDGAAICLGSDDILSTLRIATLPKQQQPSLELEWDSGSAGNAASPSPPKAIDLSNLSESQRRIVAILTETPRHIDSLALETGLSASQTGVELTLLELMGLALRMPGNLFIRRE